MSPRVPARAYLSRCSCSCFFIDTATTEIYTLSLHDALPISSPPSRPIRGPACSRRSWHAPGISPRSEEHTSELQSLYHLVCRLLLSKKTTSPGSHKHWSCPNSGLGVRIFGRSG